MVHDRRIYIDDIIFEYELDNNALIKNLWTAKYFVTLFLHMNFTTNNKDSTYNCVESVHRC